MGPASSGLAVTSLLAGCGASLQGANLGAEQQPCIENALRHGPDPATVQEALPRFLASCRAGEAASCSALGVLHELGLGVAASPTQAATLYERACAHDNARGCVNLGSVLVRGLGVPRDAARAMHLFRMACDGGDMSGCAMLGREIVSASAAGDVDHRVGRKLLEDACSARELAACVDLGDVLTASRESHEALVAYTRACVGGDAVACRRMDAPLARTSNEAAAGWRSR